MNAGFFFISYELLFKKKKPKTQTYFPFFLIWSGSKFKFHSWRSFETASFWRDKQKIFFTNFWKLYGRNVCNLRLCTGCSSCYCIYSREAKQEGSGFVWVSPHGLVRTGVFAFPQNCRLQSKSTHDSVQFLLRFETYAIFKIMKN